MSSLRPWVAIVAATLLALTVASAVLPGIDPEASAAAAVAVVGNDYVLLALLGIAATGIVLGVLGVRAVEGLDQATPPTPEGVPTARHPGGDLDRLLAGDLRAVLALSVDARRRRAVRDRLRETAVRTVSRVEGCTREAAVEQVDHASWTTDPAAALLAGSWGDAETVVRGWEFQREASAAADAIVEYARAADERRSGPGAAAGSSDRLAADATDRGLAADGGDGDHATASDRGGGRR